jgi:hypothetical protein
MVWLFGANPEIARLQSAASGSSAAAGTAVPIGSPVVEPKATDHAVGTARQQRMVVEKEDNRPNRRGPAPPEFAQARVSYDR